MEGQGASRLWLLGLASQLSHVSSRLSALFSVNCSPPGAHRAQWHPRLCSETPLPGLAGETFRAGTETRPWPPRDRKPWAPGQRWMCSASSRLRARDRRGAGGGADPELSEALGRGAPMVGQGSGVDGLRGRLGPLGSVSRVLDWDAADGGAGRGGGRQPRLLGGGLTNTVTSNLFQPRRGFTESARQAAVTEAGTRAGRMPRGQNSPRAPHTLQVRHRLPGTGAAPSPRSRCPSSCLLASRTPCGLSPWSPCHLGQPDQALGAHRDADVPTATGCPVSPVRLEGTVPRCAGGSGRPPGCGFTTHILGSP